MDLKKLSSVYFLGIGGIGMSSLARYFLSTGAKVSGYDRMPTPLTLQLEQEGMKIHFDDDPGKVPGDADLVVYTPAIPADHRELSFVRKKGIRLMKRSEVLGKIAASYYTVAVAGTHGKTTTSTLIAHILRSAGIPHIAFLGGISKNYGTNFLYMTEGDIPPVCVVEADEYDRSFLKLSPDIALVTSADPDHLDIYDSHESMLSSFSEFTGRIREGGSLIMRKGVSVNPSGQTAYNVFSYHVSRDWAGKRRNREFTASGITMSGGKFRFSLGLPNGNWEKLTLGVPGFFNLENAVGACSAAFLLGLDRLQVSRALNSFQGVVRRFDVQVRRRGFVFIDDYAHHPEELKACISAVREMYPGKRITGVFQPHLFSRTRDLAAEFAESLDLLDEVILLEIYPAREKPIPGISSSVIYERLGCKNKHLIRKTELIRFLVKLKPAVLLSLGAGDIDQLVEPIAKAMEK